MLAVIHFIDPIVGRLVALEHAFGVAGIAGSAYISRPLELHVDLVMHEDARVLVVLCVGGQSSRESDRAHCPWWLQTFVYPGQQQATRCTHKVLSWRIKCRGDRAEVASAACPEWPAGMNLDRVDLSW